ncbi:hypothetical protein TrRE_jg8305 [Triparma retinervis]|uniref:Uncharacterized protein n=1 Tax=Triparma retinervis TaxID=2557542 RepID=A0A9W7DLC6_9STRA|nr:hypothetical protein TrRE_jg8305 [Triparma retinervis]
MAKGGGIDFSEGDFSVESTKSAVEFDSAFKRNLFAMYKFTRPHTIRGTILASFAGTIRALLDSPGATIQWSLMLPKAFVGMLALLLGNAFIVGINQIYDKDIDTINKPFLPVASGEMSTRTAWGTVGLCGALGPLIVAKFFPPILLKLYMVGWVLGSLYSVPPVRTKRNPVAAAVTIALVRGFLLNFGVYYAVKDAVGVPFRWSPKVSFIARFMTVFASVIAITKDLPDIEGDKKANISTFAIKVGVNKIAKGGVLVLSLNYLFAIASGVLGKGAFNRAPMIVGHGCLLGWLLRNWAKTDTEDMKSVKIFYKKIWDLFYSEYALYTLI